MDKFTLVYFTENSRLNTCYGGWCAHRGNSLADNTYFFETIRAKTLYLLYIPQISELCFTLQSVGIGNDLQLYVGPGFEFNSTDLKESESPEGIFYFNYFIRAGVRAINDFCIKSDAVWIYDSFTGSTDWRLYWTIPGMFKATNRLFHTGRVCHVWCNLTWFHVSDYLLHWEVSEN